MLRRVMRTLWGRVVADERGAVGTATRPPATPHVLATLRHDPWIREILPILIGLGVFVIYATWRAFMYAHYYVAPYISPFYSPCLAANCEHPLATVVGPWWRLTPSLLVVWVPLGFRLSCYYARKAYYRSVLWAPPACAVRDRPASYSGETRFPWVLQNIHRYFFWLVLPIVVIHWYDVALSFRFADGFGMGLGSLIIVADATFLSLYTFSCHACRHVCGGAVNTFSRAPVRRTLWRWVSALNLRHNLWFWLALGTIVLADVYVYLLSLGTVADVRFF